LAFKLLHINPDEKRKITLYFFQNFFEGLGVSFLYTLALTQFIDNNEIKVYPWVFIISGISIMLFATVYARFEHHGIPAKLFRGLGFIIVALLMLGLAAINSGLPAGAVGVALMVLYQLIYYINKTQFWGLSALTFDVRQSKRLFSVLSVGDLPAKFIGYTLVVGLVATGKISSDQLIYASIICYIISLLVLRLIVNEQPDLNNRLGHDEHVSDHHASHGLSPIVKGLMILALANVFCVTLIDYLFAKEVSHHFEAHEESTVQLISTTMAVSYGVATLIKLFFSGRMLQRINLRILILAMPVVIIISILVFWATTDQSHMHDLYNYFFIVLFVIELIMRETLNKPLVLSLFQPLSKSERLDGHTKVKGYFESGSMLIVGLFLYNTYRHHEHIDLNYSTIVMMIVLVIWVIIGLFFGKIYLRNLRQIIKSKLLRGNRSMFLDPETAGYLRHKLKSTDDLEVINAFHVLSKNGKVGIDDLEIMICHLNLEIRTTALSMLSEVVGDTNGVKELIIPLFEDKEPTIQLLALEKYAEIATKEEWDDLLRKTDDVIRRQAMCRGACRKNRILELGLDRREIIQWLQSGDINIQRSALEFVGLITHEPFSHEIKPFLSHENQELRKAAINSCSAHLDTEGIDLMVELLKKRQHGFEVVRSLSNSEKALLGHLSSHITGSGDYCDKRLTQALVRHSEDGVKYALNFVNSKGPKMRQAILDIFLEKKIKLKGNKEIKAQIEKEIELLETLSVIIKDEELQKAIVNESEVVLQRLMKWCYLYTGEAALLRTIEYTKTKNKDKLAASVEALHVGLPQSIFSKLRPFLEAEGDNPLVSLEKFGEEMLLDHNSYRDWLVGSVANKMGSIDLGLANELVNRSSRFVRESISNSLKISAMENTETTSIKLLERVLLLKQTALFENTDENHLLEIAEVMEEKEIDHGHVVFNDGDEGNSMYIIVSGEVLIESKGHLLATLGETEFFGDLSLLDPAPRSAMASASKDTILLELNERAIYELMADHIEVTKGVIRVLCARLRRQNEQYLAEKEKSLGSF
jgi:hypothetical protein